VALYDDKSSKYKTPYGYLATK